MVSVFCGAVDSFEGDAFPEEQGWLRQWICEPEKWIEDGWLVQQVTACEGIPPPGAETEVFRRFLDDFLGSNTFFVEWRLETDGPSSEISGVAPASLVLGGYSDTFYHFTIATDQIRFIRDNLLPILFFDVTPGLSHTLRLELVGSSLYTFYIDGDVVDTGFPEGAYLTMEGDNIVWGARSWYAESMTRWDYVRFGTIPLDSSGDYDSDGDVDSEDFLFFEECFHGPEVNAGPGCRFADFDGDTDVDCSDWIGFLTAWTPSEEAPALTRCAGLEIPVVSVAGTCIILILIGVAGAATIHRRAPRYRPR